MKVKMILALMAAVVTTSLLATGTTQAFDSLTLQDYEARNVKRFAPVAPAIMYTEVRTGPLEVAKVFGRSEGCTNADADLIQATSTAAINAGIPSRLLAAVVAVESACNPLAVSQRNSLGLTQVNVKVWKSKYDFAGKDNPLNPTANLRMGSKILADLITQHGRRQALQMYLGTGTDDGNITPGSYAAKILTLAGE